MGPEWHSVALITPDFLSVSCGTRGIGRGGISPSGTLMDLGLPVMTSLPTLWNILTSSGSMISLIRIGICASASGGGQILGVADDNDAQFILWSAFRIVILKKYEG